MTPLFLLASASPARRRLLEAAGFKPIVCPSDVDESQITTTEPAELVETLAKLKAENIANKLTTGQVSLHSPSSWVIAGCDSVLSIQGEIHGKPQNAEDAISRWKMMRGKIGDLYTGHALIDLSAQKTLVRHRVTRVYFANLSDLEISAYVATGEALKCAGCFAIEGRGGLFVEKLEGCHSNVIGLSLPLLREMLNQLGYNVTDFWQ